MDERKKILTHDDGYSEGCRRMAGALVPERGEVTPEYLRGMCMSIERSLERIRAHELQLCEADPPPFVSTLPSPRHLGIDDEHGGWRIHLLVCAGKGEVWEDLRHKSLWACYHDAERFGKQMLAAVLFDLSEWTWTVAPGSLLACMHEAPKAIVEYERRPMSDEIRAAMEQFETRLRTFRDPRLAWCARGCLHKALGFAMECDESFRRPYVAGYKATQHGRALTELALDAAEILRNLDAPAAGVRFAP